MHLIHKISVKDTPTFQLLSSSVSVPRTIIVKEKCLYGQ